MPSHAEQRLSQSLCTGLAPVEHRLAPGLGFGAGGSYYLFLEEIYRLVTNCLSGFFPLVEPFK